MQPPTPCGKERVTSYHVHTTNDDPSNGKTTTWTQQTSEASGTYTFAGNEIDTDSEIKKTSILQGFVEARYVKITPITSTGIEKAQYHYKGKGQCSHNQNEGVVAGITQTSEVPDDTTCTNPRYHRLSNSLFECAEAITQDSACGSEFTYAKGGPRHLWCGCVSQGSTCNHASGSNLIQNRHGICLDANPRNTNGGTVHMYACNPAYKNQQWSYDESTGLIKNLDGICLDANPRKTNGGTVKMYQCEAHNPNQQWDYNRITGQIKNRDGICLDASKRNTNRGKVHMWACNTANENQQWDMPTKKGIVLSSGFNTYRLEEDFMDTRVTRHTSSSAMHVTTTTFTKSILANSVVLQLTKGFDTSQMRIRDIEIYDENDINIALKTKGASCVSSYYMNDPWPRIMMTESTIPKNFELGMKRKAVGSIGTDTSCNYMFDPLIRSVRHAESADGSLNFLKGRIPRSATQDECYELANDIFTVSHRGMNVNAWDHLPSGCSIRTSGAASDWDVHFNTSPNQDHQTGWATIENKCLWSDKHCNNYGGHKQCGIYEDEIEKHCGQWDLCGGVICHDSYVHAVRSDTNTVCSNRLWNRQKGTPLPRATVETNKANLAACAAAIKQDPACGDVFTFGGDRWCGCVAAGSTCHKQSYQNYDVYSLKKFCVARPALDPSTKSNSGKYAFIKHSGPKAECDGIIGHNDGHGYIHLHSESGDVGKRTGESLGMGWAEVTLPTGTRIKKIVVKQVYSHPGFKLIVRSGTVSDTSSEETLQTFDDCDATCTADDACNAFTYSEESGSCKTFSECPHLTTSNIDDSAKTYQKNTDYNEPILPSMRAGLWITDSEGSARSETGVDLVETSEGSYSRCQTDGCIFDTSKSCVDKPEIKLYPNTDSECSMGESDSGDKNSELGSGNLPIPTFTKSTTSCTPSKYCKKVGNACVIDQDKISNLRIHDPVNHGGKQCFLPRSIAVETCKTWDKCIAVICESNLVKNRHGICLDANQRNTNGGLVHMYACDPANKNQQWSYDESTGLIKNLDGICLDANPRKTNGGTVKMYQCEAHNPNQQWDYNKITGQIKNRDGICLDASERNTNRGQVHMWGCDTANENQQWNIPSSIGIMGDFCVARGQVTWRSHPSFTAHVKQAIPGLDMVGEENWYRVPQPKYQHSLLSGGAGYIQIGFWRIGDVDGENFAIGRKDIAGSVVVFTNSGYGTRGSTSFNEYTTYGKMYSLGQRKLLDAPTGIKIGNGFIEFSKKWRLYLTTTKEVLLLVHRSRGVSAAWQNTMTHIQFGVKPSETDSTVTGGVSWLASEGIKAWEQSTANCDVGRCVTFGTKHGNEFIQIGPAIICTYSKRSLSSFSPLLFFLFEWMK